MVLFLAFFCLMILINGSNFIDGLNGLLLGYCLIILFILAKLDLLNFLQFEKNLLFIFIFVFNNNVVFQLYEFFLSW